MVLVLKTEGWHLGELWLPQSRLCVVRLNGKVVSYSDVAPVPGRLGHVVDCLVGRLEEVLNDLVILLEECLHFLDQVVCI